MTTRQPSAEAAEEAAAPYHQHPTGFQPMDWLVPILDGRPIIKHVHHDRADHSQCAPAVYCCMRAALLFMDRYPDSDETRAQWQMVDGETIDGWMTMGLPQLFFMFCHPDDSTCLLTIGLKHEAAQEAVLKEFPLTELVDEASRIEPRAKLDLH